MQEQAGGVAVRLSVSAEACEKAVLFVCTASQGFAGFLSAS